MSRGCTHTGILKVLARWRDWQQGRYFVGAASLNISLTWIPRGTRNCCYEHAEQNLSGRGSCQ